MAIKTNTGTMRKGFFGTSAIKKIYMGNSLVFQGSTPYYTAGTENVSWIVGANFVTENSTYARVYTASTTALAEGYWVTNLTVDLTNINTLFIDWDATLTGTVLSGAYLCVSTAKNGAYSVYNARASLSGTFARTTTTLDVSGLSGYYYLRVHCFKRNSTGSTQYSVNVYNVWGEE